MYEIPWGGSSVLGTYGFVDAGLELAGQLTGQPSSAPLRIYLPCGTLGSAAGLMLGLGIAGVDATIVGVKVVPQRAASADSVIRLALEAQRDLQQRVPDFQIPSRLPDAEFRTEFLGGGYAIVTPEGAEGADLAAGLEGLTVDTTYSGKALACLIADARSGRLAGCTPIFWQTYNSRPYPAGLDAVNLADLPPGLRKLVGTVT